MDLSTCHRLIDPIDEDLDDIVSFADEGGTWAIGVDWTRVLRPWFRVLSATTDIAAIVIRQPDPRQRSPKR